MAKVANILRGGDTVGLCILLKMVIEQGVNRGLPCELGITRWGAQMIPCAKFLTDLSRRTVDRVLDDLAGPSEVGRDSALGKRTTLPDGAAR